MTAEEFSNEFDILYNNITSNQAPGLNAYEKSVFLTKAQDEILKSYFNPRLNKSQEGFDGNEKRQIDFSMIMKTASYGNTAFTPSTFDNRKNTARITLDSDIMMFINEFADVIRDGKRDVRLVVVPLDYKEYSRLSNKPYKRPTHYQAWRLIDNSNATNQVEIIIGANDRLKRYNIRYVKKPYPIILETLEDVTINGYDKTYADFTSTICVVPQDNITFDDTGLYITDATLFLLDAKPPSSKKNLGCVYYYAKKSGTIYKVISSTYEDNITDFTKKIKYEKVTNGPIFEFIRSKYNSSSTVTTTFESVPISEEACELDPILHPEILQRGVELAKATWAGDLSSQIALGQNSETNMGIIAQSR